MINKLFAIHDQKARAYLAPFTFSKEGQALRLFTDSIQNPEHQFSRHPEDYTLFLLGEFDDETGKIKPNTPQSLGNGVEFTQIDSLGKNQHAKDSDDAQLQRRSQS